MTTPAAARPASRVVIRAPNWLGDVVLALPAMAALRRHFAEGTLAVATPPGLAALFREDTDVRPDEILELPDTPRGEIALLDAGRFDLGILFQNSFRGAWTVWRAGIRERWGYATSSRGWLLTKRASRPRVKGVQHQADYYRGLVRGFEIPCDDDAPRIGLRAPTREGGVAWLAEHGAPSGTRLVAMAPGAAYGQAKQWLPDRVAELAARLVAERDATCLILGASHDRATARAIESWLRSHAPEAVPRVVDLAGRTSLMTLCGALAACELLVSNDSGAMHLASALGRPVVAVFGPTDERATRPLGPHVIVSAPVFCRPCLLRDCPIDHRCMKRIAVDQVFAAVSRELAFGRGT
jgi:heptosyltransferase-2